MNILDAKLKYYYTREQWFCVNGLKETLIFIDVGSDWEIYNTKKAGRNSKRRVVLLNGFT